MMQIRPRVARAPVNASTDPSPAPWEISTYYTKKTSRRTDRLGNVLDGETAASPAWTAEARIGLAVEALSPRLGRSPAQLQHGLRQLNSLLPGAQRSLARMQPAGLVQLADCAA